MIKVTNIETSNWQAAIRGMRNPMNSWDKSDTVWGEKREDGLWQYSVPEIGNDDLDLAQRLVRAGSDHRKFMRQIFVSMDITAPLYWWKEFDTYKVGTVANSCSTMHKIHAKEFTLDDFSHEHLLPDEAIEFMKHLVDGLNFYRLKYLETKDKRYWWQMIQLLPSSYNQLRTVTMNYENLLNMYHARKNHKLDEWREFCKVIETLPYAKELICDVQR